MRVGVNSYMVREIAGGPVSVDDGIDIVELSAEDIPMFNRDGSINHEVLNSLLSYDVAFSLHAPNSDASLPEIRVDLGVKADRNMKVMERCFEIASFLDIKHVVVHGGDVSRQRDIRGDLQAYRAAFLNTIENLRSLAALARDYQVTLCAENLCDDRVGCIPAELLAIIHSCECDILATIDTGHAFITALKYGFEVEDFFYILAPFVEHVHLHSNNGFKDEHLPLYEGKMNVNSVLNAIYHVNPTNVILEIRNFSSCENVMNSLNAVKRCVLV